MGLLNSFLGAGPSLVGVPNGGVLFRVPAPAQPGPGQPGSLPLPPLPGGGPGPLPPSLTERSAPPRPSPVQVPTEPNHGAPAPQSRYPTAYAAADIHAMVLLPGGTPRSLGNLSALSVSSHRDAFPVTTIGAVSARGFTQGHRTVAGTLIFHTLDRNAFNYGLNPYRSVESAGGVPHSGPPHPDSLPLFDIHVTYVNDQGTLSFEALYGVRLLDFGKTVSLESLHPLESYSYMALDYSPMESLVAQAPAQDHFTLAPPRSRALQPVRMAEDKNAYRATYDPQTGQTG